MYKFPLPFSPNLGIPSLGTYFKDLGLWYKKYILWNLI